MDSITLAKLQYEILQVSLKELAEELGVPLNLLEEEARINNWTVLWPEKANTNDDTDTDKDDIEAYIEDRQKRLTAYSVAKEILLSQKYLELEANIITKASNVLDAISIPYSSTDAGIISKAIKDLSGLYKDMTKNRKNLELSLGLNSQGLPTAVVRDLSGQ
jgi:hypothetical protein